MGRMKLPGDQKIRFEITTNKPEESPERYALMLAEAFNGASLRQTDSETFHVSAQSERRKAQQIQDIIFQLKEREKNPVEKVSRMDPLNDYDLEACENQLKDLKENSEELQKKSDEYSQEANGHRQDIVKLQKLIREAHAKAQ